MGSPFRLPLPAQLAFSGGRTSGKLLWEILQAFGGKCPDDLKIIFANTGKEQEATLRFVRECGVRWKVPIHWVEYWRDPTKPLVIERGSQKIIGCHSLRVVNFETASRNGEPFEQLVQVKAEYRREVKDADPVLPNPAQRFCSGELKQRTMHRYMRQLGYDDYTTAVGLRADEPGRVSKLRAQSNARVDYVCPLASAGVKEIDVLRFWERQPFDLELLIDPELGTYQGNCDFCFLKKRAKIKRLASEDPVGVAWWSDMELITRQRFRKDRFTYTDLREGRVELTVLPAELIEQDADVCLCTD